MSIGLIDSEDSGICVHVPMMLKRRSGRKEVIVPDGLENSTDSGTSYHEALVVAISRAHRLKKLLDEGKYRSVAEMAYALKMNRYTRPGGDEIVPMLLFLSQKRKNPARIPAGSNATENGSILINGRATVSSTNRSMNIGCCRADGTVTVNG